VIWGSSRLSKDVACIGERLKSVPERGTEHAVVDRAVNPGLDQNSEHDAALVDSLTAVLKFPF
jgi:hypothetical protein